MSQQPIPYNMGYYEMDLYSRPDVPSPAYIAPSKSTMRYSKPKPKPKPKTGPKKPKTRAKPKNKPKRKN